MGRNSWLRWIIKRDEVLELERTITVIKIFYQFYHCLYTIKEKNQWIWHVLVKCIQSERLREKKIWRIKEIQGQKGQHLLV